MDVDYSQILADIAESVEELNVSVDTLQKAVDGSNANTQNLVDIGKDVKGIEETLKHIAGGTTGNRAVDVDYTTALHNVQELLVYTDVMLIVLIVLAVLILGVSVGKIVTDRMRLH